MTGGDISVDGFNALPEAEATQRLLACLSVPRWAAEVAGGRPYADYAALTAQAEASAAELSDDDLPPRWTGHPRIGERAGAGHDAEFSAREQAGWSATTRRYGRVWPPATGSTRGGSTGSS